MGLKGSKPIESNNPVEITNSILRMLSSKETGSFGSFIKKDTFLKNSRKMIHFISKNFDILLQYPISLTDTNFELTPRMNIRKKLSKKYIHKIITITDESSKEKLLKKILNTPSITAFKVFLAKEQDKFNTFEREILRYREQLTFPQETSKTTIAVAELESKLGEYPFTVYEDHFFANPKNYNLLNNVSISYISCSLKLKNQTGIPYFLHKLDFIFLKECIGGSLGTVPKIDFFKLIRDIIPAIHILHTKNIYHMDIKVDNIIKCDKSYKLIDFGLSYQIPQVEHETIKTEKKANAVLNDYIYKMKEYDDDIHQQIIDLQKLHPSKNSIIEQYIKGLVPNSALFYINPILLAFIYQIIFDTKQKLNLILEDLQDSYKTTIKTKFSKSIDYKIEILNPFMSHYIEYITPNNYIDFDKIQRNYHTFIRNLYNRHDWYCLAITLLLLYDKFTSIPSTFKKGIQKLVSLSDQELISVNLDKKILELFYSNTKSRRSIQPTYVTKINN